MMNPASVAVPVVPRSVGARLRLSVHAPLLLALAIHLVSGQATGLAYLFLSFYALLGREHAIRALAMSWVLTMLNPELGPETVRDAVGRPIVLFAAAASVMVRGVTGQRQPRIRAFTFGTLLLGLFLLMHSWLTSAVSEVSILKSLSWTLVMVTLISAWAGLSPAQRHQVEYELFAGLALIVICSLPLLGTSAGYARNGTGFQGILNHPQAFGSAMALLGAWSVARLLSFGRPVLSLLCLACASIVMILLSECRTAGLAMTGALALCLLHALRQPGSRFRRMIGDGRIWPVLAVLTICSGLLAPAAMSAGQSYLGKSGRAEPGNLAEIYWQSRGVLIEPMLANIAQSPWFGSGFGIASDPAAMWIIRDPVFGLPVSASVEKGVAPLMVLEEVGIIGAALTGAWILFLIRGSAKAGPAQLATCLTALLLNLGEATLFSPGGFGLLPLILLGWSHSGKLRRKWSHG